MPIAGQLNMEVVKMVRTSTENGCNSRLLYKAICLVSLMLWIVVARCQCPPGIGCPPGCYPAEILGFWGQCGSIGVFPNQWCCITIYLKIACRENPDCTGQQCGIALIPIATYQRGGGCQSNVLGWLICGDVVYAPGDNHVCTSQGCDEFWYIPGCPFVAPSPGPVYIAYVM